MKRGLFVVFVFLIFLFSIMFVSAGWFSDLFHKNKVTGNALDDTNVSVNSSSWKSGMVSWWKFDGNANDYFGIKNGTVSGATLINTSCKSGKCYSFDGINDYISLGYAPQYNIRQAITLSVWMKRTTNYNQTRDVMLLSRSPSWYFYDAYNSGMIRGDVYINGTRRAGIYSKVIPFDNNWYHVLYTYDSSTRLARMYQNGVLVGSVQLTNLSNYLIDSSTAGFSNIGYQTLGRGLILDEFMIWNRSLSEAEVQQVYNSFSGCTPNCVGKQCGDDGCGGSCGSCSEGYTCSSTGQCILSNITNWQSGMFSWWKFDGNANDYFGINNGTVSGATLTNTSCKSGKCYRFDGTNDYIEMSGFSQNYSKMTYAYWINNDFEIIDIPTGSYEPIFYYNTGRDYSLFFGDDRFVANFHNSTTQQHYVNWKPFTINKSEWHHIANVYDADNGYVSLYLDGVLVGNRTYSPWVVGPKIVLRLGRYGSYYYNGSIDEFMVWNRALNPTEVQQMYNSFFGCTSDYECNDNNSCTTDLCSKGICTNIQVSCNDNNPCTTDLCTNGICVYNPITSCINGDGCCPSGCSLLNDNDCETTVSSWQKGIILWLKMEGNALDSSNYSWKTADGGVSYVNGRVGKGASGFSETKKISVDSSLDFASTNMTLSFWMNVKNYTHPARQNPFGKAYGGDGTITLEKSGYMSFYFGSSGMNAQNYTNDVSGHGSTVGVWEHWTITRDRTSRKTQWYKNGVASGSPYIYSTSFNPVHSTNNLTIGDDYVYPLNGTMDEVIIWNRVLNSTEVQQVYTFFADFKYNYSSASCGSCSSGYYCNSSGYCNTLKYDGEVCFSDSECRSGACDYDIFTDNYVERRINTNISDKYCHSNSSKCLFYAGWMQENDLGCTRCAYWYHDGFWDGFIDTCGSDSKWINYIDCNGSTPYCSADSYSGFCNVTCVECRSNNDCVEREMGFCMENHCIYLKDDRKSYFNISIGDNKKNMSMYLNKEVFLVSDLDWRRILPLVPLTTWTKDSLRREDSCNAGYGTPQEVCVYPTLIYHQEFDYENQSNIFDADSVIYFMQQYNPNKLTVVEESPQELDNLLIANPELGAGLKPSKIQRISNRINPYNYFYYWSSYKDIVYVEDNYELALVASTYASLINAPLVISGSELDFDKAFEGRNVTCVGNFYNSTNPRNITDDPSRRPPSNTTNSTIVPISIDSLRNCTEKYNLEQLQQKYVNMTNTDKIILVNPEDLDIQVSDDFLNPYKSSSIYELYSKTSLISPFLASAKHELILSLKQNPYNTGLYNYYRTGPIYNDSTRAFYVLASHIDTFGMNPKYLTIVSAPNAIPDKEYAWTDEFGRGSADVYYSLDQNLYSFGGDLYVGRIMGLTSSDVSAYVARDLFYSSILNSTNVLFMASSSDNNIGRAFSWYEEFKDSNYNSTVKTSPTEAYQFDRELWERYYYNFISYNDHGGGNWMGIPSWHIPKLNKAFISADACSTISTYDSQSFWAIAIRNGAIGYIGAVGVGYNLDAPLYRDTINGIYYYNLSIGEALGTAYEDNVFNNLDVLNIDPMDKYRFMTTLIGDPTLRINPQYKLKHLLDK